MNNPAPCGVLADKQYAPSVIAVDVIYVADIPFYNFTDGFIFINPIQNEKDLNGIPKIALRKSET